ncbi:LrgB family protein [Thalassolituus hydrocarboniclasticus]|uniref:LrgB family protein n=1 Tax=Thalassolituus hydrocarboniclasticus TaxID=2742796 RepID=A0ABY6A705_9GAMM|nr:LrgB family protein [Thalassolituus hydrocarboniclasticus]UXD86019.1 LrgB family protein [Thalassolituus hydrocarboniclasticus]
MTQLLSLPLFWAALTIAAFLAGQQLYRRTGNNAFIPPILTGIVLVVSCLELSGVSYVTYMQGGDYLHQMLGPVVVMLAVPLYQFIHTMRKQWLRIALAVTLGSGTTVACAVLLAHFWIGDDAITRTISAKSITTPVAVAISEQVGGISALASAFVIVTGILGALMIPPLLKLLRMDEPQTLGLTLGICAHAIGTSRALELGPQQSAYAAMAMTLTATLHALVLPWIV